MNQSISNDERRRGIVRALAYEEASAAAANLRAACEYWRALWCVLAEAVHRALRGIGGAR
jgi:hypothetical protein